MQPNCNTLDKEIVTILVSSRPACDKKHYSTVLFLFVRKENKVEKQQKSLVIINDHQFLSDLLERHLQAHWFEAVNSFTDVKVGLEYVFVNPTDLVIIDMMLPVMRTRVNGDVDIFHPYILMDNQTSFKAVTQIRQLCLDTKVLILTGERHPHTFQLGFEAGAHGIASKLDGLPAFLIILGRIMAGEEQIVSERMQPILEEYERTSVPSLTRFEIQILELVQEGLESTEIGRELGYSAKTIRNTLSKINEKLGTSNRFQALEVAIDMGLVGWRQGCDETN